MRKGIASRSLTTQLLENVFLSLLAAGFTFITFYLLVAFVDIRLAGYDHLLLDRTFRYSVLGVCVALAFLFFCVSYTVLIRNKLRYLQTLKASLDTMAGGELEQAVPIQGYDELSELAIGMDEMRRSFLAYIREEDRIRSANSQLVTAMSHDLRTPLTSLMAYLELLDRQKYTGEDQMRHLIKQSLVQAQAIKAMTNKLFEYFLVYASEWEQPVMEDVDADGLICPLWREYVFGLENEGFQVTVAVAESTAVAVTPLTGWQRSVVNSTVVLQSLTLVALQRARTLTVYVSCEARPLMVIGLTVEV